MTKVNQTVEDYSINFSAKIEFKYLRLDQKKIANFHFSRFKSIETLSCHSNQISYPTEIKKKHKLCKDYCQEHVYKVQASCHRQFLRRRF